MSTLRIINKKITLDPQYLDSNYKTYLLQKLKDNIKNECNKEYGYYLDLKRIVSIKDNNITSNSEIIFAASSIFLESASKRKAHSSFSLARHAQTFCIWI